MAEQTSTAARVLGPKDGQILGSPKTITDRFMINGSGTGGRFAVVEHTLAPRALAAPLHLHTKEPGGLEELFRILGTLDQFPDEDELASLTSGYGCEADLDGTALVVERHGLKF